MQCSKCQKEMKLVAAGTSKRTGKPYNAFYSCDRECGETAPSDQVYAPPEKEPQDTGGTILLEEIKGIETAIGNLELAMDGIGDRLDKMCEWIKDNVK